MNKNRYKDKILSIVTVSDVVLEPYFENAIKQIFIEKEYCISLKEIQVSEIDEHRESMSFADIIVIIIDFQNRYGNLDIGREEIFNDMKCTYELIKSMCSTFIVWFSLEIYSSYNKYFLGHVYSSNEITYYVNEKIAQYLYPGDIFVDLAYIIAEIGIKRAFNFRNKYRWNSPYSRELIYKMGNEICKQFLIHIGSSKKCLVLDCDNVLWGGTIAEDGIDGISLSATGMGRQYQDFQKFLLKMHAQGVILTICSKNDIADIMDVFRNHSEMILCEEHIAYFQVNWNDKATNILEISHVLNIGLDNMVFVDDSGFEIDFVKTTHPNVTAFRYRFPAIFEYFSCFNLKDNYSIDIVKERNNTYRTNVFRNELKENCVCFDEYLCSLKMKVDIHKALLAELGRLSELTQRTNKFTNGKRYTLENLRDILFDGNYELFSVYLSDKFSDLGLVGTFGIRNKTLDLFSLSCRALGRKIEFLIFDFVKSRFQITHINFILTDKNSDFYLCLKNNFDETRFTNADN